jgi:hypothetical protein
VPGFFLRKNLFEDILHIFDQGALKGSYESLWWWGWLSRVTQNKDMTHSKGEKANQSASN